MSPERSEATSMKASTAHNYLSQITAETPSFSFVEYFLRLSLQASTPRIHSLWEISNPQLTLQFEKRTKGLLVLDAWVQVNTTGPLGPDNTDEDAIIERGFAITASQGEDGTPAGLRFTVGRIPMDNTTGSKDVTVRRMMLCKIAVGRAYNATEDFAKLAAIPEGYDSFILDRERPPADPNSSNTAYDYVIKDAAQVLPTFVLVFEYDPEAEKRSRQRVTCENCEEAPAVVFCQADAANLCAKCNQAMHTSKLSQRHVRLPLEAGGPQTFSSCRQHPDKIVEFFCLTCSRPVCVTCKMIGHHAVGDAARHKLVTVGEAFKSVSEAASAADPILASRRNAIQGQLRAVEARAAEVEANAAEVQRSLEELLRKAQGDLKALTKKKLNILKGDMIELNRQAASIGALEAFLAYQQTGGNATQFILDWAHHQRLRSELHGFAHFREHIDVQPDLRISGAVQVVLDGGGTGNADFTAAAAGGERPRYSPARPNRILPSFDTLSIRGAAASAAISAVHNRGNSKPLDYSETVKN